MLKARLIDGEKFISHRFALSDLAKAMELCRDDKENAVKVVVNPI